MQYPFNWLALEIARHGLRESCVVHVEDKVWPEVNSVDAWVEPRVGRLPQPDDDWLTRMGYEPAEIEPFHLGPSLGDHNDTVMKVMALHARERKLAKDEGRPEPPTPRLWFVCAQHPRELLARWAMVSMEPKGWPRGFYESVAPAGPRAVSLRELPLERSTLLLRLMGAGKVLRQAVEELEALEPGARERRVAAPILLRLKGDLPRMGVTVTWSTPEEYETMMSHEEAVRIFEEREAKLIAAAQAKAAWERAQAEAERAQAEAERAQAYRALTDAERDAVVARFHELGPERFDDATWALDAAALAAWLADPAAR